MIYEAFPDIEDIYMDREDPDINREVTITRKDIEENVCNCSDCKETHKCHDWCDRYIERLVAAYPVGEPIMTKHGFMVYPVMGGYVPKGLIDKYTDDIAERLKSINLRDLKRYETKRPIYYIDELEDERRQLHIAILCNAGFYPLEVGIEAVAFKIVIEKFVENRLRKLGVLK
jgi:hypothetical protein